jgi:dihydropteroate synthase
MGIINVTPDSFSDGGEFLLPDSALARAERLIGEGADIIDVGGESTRPGSAPVDADEEAKRVIPVIEAIVKRFDVPVSVDTTKYEIAKRALDSGAEIVNDVSGLRFDDRIADLTAERGSGLVLMHSRGKFETLHIQEPVDDILSEVHHGLAGCLSLAASHGVADEQIVIDPGIGFGKSFDQNLELLARLDKVKAEFPKYPILVGVSRKSFIGRVLDDVPTEERLYGSLAAAAIAVWNGASIVRTHDVAPTVESMQTVHAIRSKL